MLIKTVADLKAHLGRAINKATTDDYLLPFVQLAQDEFILPSIGAELLNELDQQYNSSVPTALTNPNAALLKRLQRALAWYAYWKYLPFAIGNDGDNGLQEQGTDSTKPVRIGVLDKRQRESIINASNAIEAAMQYLNLYRASYPTWTASSAYVERNKLFINSATELTQHLPFALNSYRLFLTLMPYLRRAEQQAILPTVSVAQFNALKTYRLGIIIDGNTESLLYRIREAVANVAYAEALFHLNVVQTPAGGLRIVSEFDGINNEKAPESKQLLDAQSQATASANRYLKALKEFLNKNADTYPIYKASDRFAAPNSFDIPDNTSYKGIFRMR